jgi:thiamine biosynthesis protein ThiC
LLSLLVMVCVQVLLQMQWRCTIAELETLGELSKIAWKHDVQVFIEGPWSRSHAHD